jgi:uncharacterized protein (TIGR00297 family)
VVGTTIYVCLDWPGFAILGLFVAGGSALTRLGYAAKRRRGISQSEGGRRGARNALANCGVAVICALAATLTPFHAAFTAAFAASLGAAFADTAESEVGQLASRRPRLLVGLRAVPPGTDGAISASGTLAGVLAAGATAILALGVGLVEGGWGVLIVWASAFLGTIADSLVGVFAPRVGNELTNVLCTLVAAMLALALV